MHRSAQSLFHRNLDRILTHFGDNQRLGYSIRGSTVGCNRRAEILAVSSEELHHLAIIKTPNADDAVMGRSHHVPCSYLIDVGTIFQVSINPIQRSLRLIRCFISICYSINRNMIGSRKRYFPIFAQRIRCYICISYCITSVPLKRDTSETDYQNGIWMLPLISSFTIEQSCNLCKSSIWLIRLS